MREMKDCGVAWLGKIPKNWSVTRIKNLFELRNERNYDDLENVNLISLYTDKGVVQHSDLEKTTGNKAVTADGYKIVRQGDIVVNIILCWMGAVGRSDYNGVTSPAYDIYLPLNDTNSEYYHYLFRTSQFNGECYRYGRGIMMMRWRTYSDEFRAIHIPFPPIDEQIKIVNYLRKKEKQIDALIANQQAQIEKLKQYKQSLITEVVTKGLDPDAPMKNSDVEWIGTIPKTWECKPIKFLSSFNDETLSENTKPDYEFEYIEIGSVEFGKGIIGTEHMKFADAPSRARRIVKENDVIVSTVRTYLKAVAPIPYCEDQLIASTGFVVIRPKDIEPSFLRYSILSTSFISRVEAYSVGISYPAINASQVVQFKVPVPSRETQIILSSFLDEKCGKVDKLIAVKSKKIEELNRYKKSLIYEYVTGKKEVS